MLYSIGKIAAIFAIIGAAGGVDRGTCTLFQAAVIIGCSLAFFVVTGLAQERNRKRKKGAKRK